MQRFALPFHHTAPFVDRLPRSLRLWMAILGATLSVQAQPAYDRHVLFANGLGPAWHDSTSSVVAPSRLGVVQSRFPLDTQHFHSAPDALKLQWLSAKGGDWRMTFSVPARYGRSFTFSGDSLTFWCLADSALDPSNTPRFYVIDTKGVGTPGLPLLKPGQRIPPGTWTQLRLPFKDMVLPFKPTDDARFDPTQFASLTFVQGLDDARPHTLWIDDVRIENAAADPNPPTRPLPPVALQVRGFERHCEVEWSSTASEVFDYRLERSLNRGPYQAVATVPGYRNRCVDFTGGPGAAVRYRLFARTQSGIESAPVESGVAHTHHFSDEELLNMVQEGCFRYYRDAAHPIAGLAIEVLPGNTNLVAVGGSGFGLAAWIAATQRGFVSRDAATTHFLKAVRFLAGADRFHGAWPHFLDGRTGKTIAQFGRYDNGGDLVETAFMIQSLLIARQFFDGSNKAEREIRETCTRLWQEVEWDWYRRDPQSPYLYWHWSPDHGFHISHPLIGWNETLIVYLLAIASPTHGIPPELYHTGWASQSPEAVAYRQGWSRTTEGDHYTNGHSYFGIPLAVGEGSGAELCFTEFSFIGFDPRGIRDRYANYFENNRNIARISHAYARKNPRQFKGYSARAWGRSAGINAGGGRALERDDNGTLSIHASLASFPYTPRESMAALKHFYRDLGPKVWGIYGFHDGFNEQESWFEQVNMALNQGPIVAMIENHRSQRLWRLFMSNAEITGALDRIGFVRDDP